MGGFRGITRILAFVRIAVLARLLSPEDFGAVGIAALVLAFLEIFTETGVNTVLIQEKSKLDKYLDTAWMISIFRGVLMGVLILVSAPLVARFFNSPNSLYVIATISLVPLVKGFINPAIVKYQKDLEFNKEFYFRLVVFSVDAISAIVVTLLTRHPMGIVVGFIVGAIFEVAMSFKFVQPKPKFSWDSRVAKKIIDSGKWVTGAGISQYLFRQGDDIVVGKVLGQYSLGVYQAAYRISTLPITEVSDVAGKVMFPVISKMKKTEIRSAFMKSVASVTFVSLLLGSLIYIFPDLIVGILLGPGWEEVIPILQILAIFGVIRSFSTSFNSLFLGTSNQKYVTSTTVFSTVVMFAIIWPLITSFGLSGAAYATIIASASSIPLTLYYARKTFEKLK